MTKSKKVSEIAVENRKARYLYFIEQVIEAGIVLYGEEIQSIRKGKVSIDHAYASERDNAIWMYNSHIQVSQNATIIDEKKVKDPIRPRKLLLKKKEIDKIKIKLFSHGYTLIPLNIHYNKKGFAKIDLGLSKGRKKEDKREYKKEQDWKIQKARMLKNIR